MWRITKDWLEGTSEGVPSRVHFEGDSLHDPLTGHTPLPTKNEAGEALPLVKFRLYDDDGDLYYEGELHDDEDALNQAAALKFGEADAGCTTIKVRRESVVKSDPMHVEYEAKWTQEIG